MTGNKIQSRSKHPRISIIVPVYNRPKELALTLASIKKQTYTYTEIIIIDDGSTEALHVKHQLSNSIFYRQENKGAPAARNKGFALSKGEYVIFWDGDAVGKPETIQKMYDALQEHPEASYAYCNFHFGNKKIPSQVFDAKALRQQNYIHTTSLIRRTDFFGFDESIKKFQDWDLWLTMLEQKKQGVWIDEFLFRILPGGTISNWLPRFAYCTPWKWLPGIQRRVHMYEVAKKQIIKKHQLDKNNFFFD